MRSFYNKSPYSFPVRQSVLSTHGLHPTWTFSRTFLRAQDPAPLLASSLAFALHSLKSSQFNFTSRLSRRLFSSCLLITLSKSSFSLRSNPPSQGGLLSSKQGVGASPMCSHGSLLLYHSCYWAPFWLSLTYQHLPLEQALQRQKFCLLPILFLVVTPMPILLSVT